MVATLKMHTSEFLTAPSQAPKVFTLRGMPGGLESHDFYGATVPCGFFTPDPPHWIMTKGGALFQVWCAQELGPNGCRNLDRDA
jgi:hypothetical protein